MNFLWAGTSKPQNDKADHAFSSPTSLASRFGNRITTPSISPRSRGLKKVVPSRQPSKLDVSVVDDILVSTTIVSSKKNTAKSYFPALVAPLSFDLTKGSEVALTPTKNRSRSLSPVTKTRSSSPSCNHAHVALPEQQGPKRKEAVEEDLNGARVALSNADSVIAKATDSFKKTFDFISKTTGMETTTEAMPSSPSTVSTRPETPPMSPPSPPAISETTAVRSPSAKSLTPIETSATSKDSKEYDPIMETRSYLSYSPAPDIPTTTSAVSLDSMTNPRFSKAKRAIDNWKSQSRDLTEKSADGSPETRVLDHAAKGIATGIAATSESAISDRELALLKLQASLSNLGTALSTAAWGDDGSKHRDPPSCELPSLLHATSTEITLEELLDPSSSGASSVLPRAASSVAESTTLTGTDIAGVKQSSKTSCTSSISVDRSLATNRDPGGLKLHDSLSVLPAYAFESAWMSYCDLPSLLQSNSSTLSVQEALPKSIPQNAVTAEPCSPIESRQSGTDYVLMARASPAQSMDASDDRLVPNLPQENQQKEGDRVLSHEETLAEMQASLDGLLSTVQASVFGNDEALVQKAVDNKHMERTKLCPSPQLEGRKQRALEPEEKPNTPKRIGLEPEEQTEFGVEELIMKVENEEITCLTEESYEVVSETKYYPVEVASSGLGIPADNQVLATSTIKGPDFYIDEMVERSIHANFYLEESMVDVPLDASIANLQVHPAERHHYETWAALSYRPTRSSDFGEESVHPAVQAANEIRESPLPRSKGEDPPGQGPWSATCMEPCFTENTDSSTSSNFVFCHQSPKDLSDSLNASLLEIGSQVQRLDEENHVTENVSKSVSDLGFALTKMWKKADRAFGVSVATKQVSTVLKETAKNPPKPEDLQRHLQQLDEEHRIVEQTAAAVAEGAQFLAQSIESLAIRTPKPGTMITAG